MAKVKRLYEMTGRELREEAERAEAAGDTRRAQDCREHLAMNVRISEAFRESCNAPLASAKQGDEI